MGSEFQIMIINSQNASSSTATDGLDDWSTVSDDEQCGCCHSFCLLVFEQLIKCLIWFSTFILVLVSQWGAYFVSILTSQNRMENSFNLSFWMTLFKGSIHLKNIISDFDIWLVFVYTFLYIPMIISDRNPSLPNQTNQSHESFWRFISHCLGASSDPWPQDL